MERHSPSGYSTTRQVHSFEGFVVHMLTVCAETTDLGRLPRPASNIRSSAERTNSTVIIERPRAQRLGLAGWPPTAAPGIVRRGVGAVAVAR